MAESYIERKKQRDALEEQKNHIIFGLMGGVILAALGVFRWLSATGIWELLYPLIAGIGLLFILLAIVVPIALKYPYKAFRFFGNCVGKAIFAVILTILYIVIIFPVGLLLRRKREAQGYFAWDQAQPKPRSMFAELEQAQDRASKSKKATYLGIVLNLFSGLLTNRKYILIPAVVILVIVGLILFFVSSNVVTAFIYTFF